MVSKRDLATSRRLQRWPRDFSIRQRLRRTGVDTIVHVSTSQGSLYLDGRLQRLGLSEKQLSASVALSFEGLWPESGRGKASPVSTWRRAPRNSAG